MKRAIAIMVALALALPVAFVPLAANADRGHGRGGHPGARPQHWEVRVHNHRHQGHWRRGHHHGHHGWWWVVGGLWYFYPRVVYPYPNYPASVVIQQPPVSSGPPPAQHWYYCESANNYYPYVATCAEGWKQVPATPPQ